MRALRNIGVRNNIDLKTIMFCKNRPKNVLALNKTKTRTYDIGLQQLFLLSKRSDFSIYNAIPKNFSISTKNGTSRFNLDMLKEVSPVITSFIQDHPNEHHYNLNINDEENALSKFEQLFLGKTVYFDEDELPSSQRITKILQIKNCPNYLKPKSLRTSEVYSNGTRIYGFDDYNLKTGVKINESMFVEYLGSEELQKFKIKTKKNEYRCNIYGIYSSNVIRTFLEADDSKSEFEFDFEDEFDEFQLICDFFNFKTVDIKSDNMDSLKDIASDLQINCIIKQIEDYINNYENFSQKVDEQQAIIDSIDSLFDLLYNVRNYGIQKVKLSIAQSEWSQKVEAVQELAAFILQVVKFNISLHREMADLLVELNNEASESNKLDILIPFIVDRMMSFYMSKPPSNSPSLDKPSKMSLISKKVLYQNFLNDSTEYRFVFNFIRLLYKRGIISKDEIIEKLKYNRFDNRHLIAFFLPEILEVNPKDANAIARVNSNMIEINFSSFIEKFLPDKIDLYTKMLDQMEPDDELTKSLRRDDVDTLQLIVTRNEIDISRAVVPYNIFDDLEENPTIINYSAYCGSIKCFKYLILNDGQIDKNTIFFAVYGGNIEIIKIVDQRMPAQEDEEMDKDKKYGNQNEFIQIKFSNGNTVLAPDYCNDSKIISPAVQMHRNDLFDWVFENRFVSKGNIGNSLKYIASLSASNGNAHSLVEIIDKGFDITLGNVVSYSAKNGFCKLTQLLLSIINQKVNKNYSSDSNEPFNYKYSVLFGNLSMFKLFIKQMNQSDFEEAIPFAIELGYKKIVDYFLDNIGSIDFVITESFIKSSLISSFKLKTDEFFNFLVAQFKNSNPQFFIIKLVVDLLDHACLSSNFLAVKTLTEIILNEDPKVDFSSSFIKASASGTTEICQFFIDKKVFINYDEFSTKVSELGSIDVELFKMIINNVDPDIRYQFFRCLDRAIRSKNKKLIEFLMIEKAPIKNALFEAVNTHDLEIVELILKYNSSPSFVNLKNSDGTALHAAVSTKDFLIVKRLLAVPGIDAGMINLDYQSPLSIAARKYDLIMIGLILDFFGEKIITQLWNIIDILVDMLNSISSINSNTMAWKVIQRLLEIKYIDPNMYIEQMTFLVKACALNEIDVVENLLKIENIDVNKYDTDNYSTPLMIALNNRNQKLAEILIKYPKTDLNLRNIVDESALHIAVRNNLTDIVVLLINDKRFDPIESGLNYSFYLANYEIAKILTSSSFLDINYVFELTKIEKNDVVSPQNLKKTIKTTSLIHSVEVNNIEKIDLIINNPSFNLKISNLNKAIFVAAKMNNINVFKTLISLINCDINICNRKKQSLLSFASKNLSGEIIDEILTSPSFDPKNREVLNAFISSYSKSSKKRNDQLPNHLRRHIARRRRQDQDQNQNEVLHTELIPNKSSTTEIMEKIYNYDNEHCHLIDFTKLVEDGKSFFTVISKDYNDLNEVSNFLIEHGADPNMKDEKGTFPLEHAIRINSVNMINSLIDSNKIDLSQLSHKNSYLHLSAKLSDAATFKCILDKNLIDINSVNDDGETPLIIACKLLKADIVNLLFDKENLDYLHADGNGIDALCSLVSLPKDEIEEAKKNKEIYQKKIISVIKEKSMSDHKNE